MFKGVLRKMRSEITDSVIYFLDMNNEFLISDSILKVLVKFEALLDTNESWPSISSPVMSSIETDWPTLTLLILNSGTSAIKIIGFNWIIFAQRAPGCSRVPNSAVSVSKIPSNGAFNDIPVSYTHLTLPTIYSV